VIIELGLSPDRSRQINHMSAGRSFGEGQGDLVECPNCAGHALRVQEAAGRWSATLAYRVSCPMCDEVITLPDDVKPGDTVRCCGRNYRLTFEYGAYAAEDG